jgi:transmembrane sensor
MAAYLEVAALWNESGSQTAKERWSIERLIEDAKREPDNVVSLTSLPAPEGELEGASASLAESRPRWSTRSVVVGLAASVLLAVFFVSMWTFVQRNTYSTGTGEQRSVTLADGSTVQLNARSKLRVRFSETERDIELVQGQALFQVAKNPQRPFIVSSAGTRVRAVGTQFDVYRKPSGVVVTVIEGRVAVFGSAAGADVPASTGHTLDRGASPVYLSAGEQLTSSGATHAAPRTINPATATAWTQRQIVLEATPLSEATEEFNRYNQRQFVIRDPALNSFQIDGVFSSTDPAPMIRFLRSRPGILVIESGSEIVIASRQRPAVD